MVKLASRKNASPRCLISCFVPIGKQWSRCYAGMFSWETSCPGIHVEVRLAFQPLRSKNIFGVWWNGGANPRTNNTIKKRKETSCWCHSGGSVRGPSSVSWSFRSVTDPHRWPYNIGGISPIGTMLRARHLPITQDVHRLQSERVRANQRQRWSRSTWGCLLPKQQHTR